MCLDSCKNDYNHYSDFNSYLMLFNVAQHSRPAPLKLVSSKFDNMILSSAVFVCVQIIKQLR